MLFSKLYNLIQVAIMRLQESGLLLDDIITKVSAITNESNQQVKAIFEDAGIEAVEWDSEIYEAALYDVREQ